MTDVSRILSWLEAQRAGCTMAVREVPIPEVERWRVDPSTGEISHETGEFFRVIGLRVEGAANREREAWCQPIVAQKEMGILGLLVQERGGVDRYLLQAKAEPGNVGRVLISPTLQSTVSNLKQAHGGSLSRFALYFIDRNWGQVLYERYQAEDGGRFYLKTNLNMVVRISEKIEMSIPEDFIWASMAEIKALLQHENLVAAAVRSIISALP